MNKKLYYWYRHANLLAIMTKENTEKRIVFVIEFLSPIGHIIHLDNKLQFDYSSESTDFIECDGEQYQLADMYKMCDVCKDGPF